LSFTEHDYQITKNPEIMKKFFNQIKEKMKSQGFIIAIDMEHWVLRMEDKVLFSSCSVDINMPRGRALVETLGRVMFKVLEEEEFKKSVETVFIEGHTDNNPPKGECRRKFPTNWELSAKRAINTWNIMVSGEPRLNSLRNIYSENMFSVSGYGQTRPIATNLVEIGKKRNRRIDVRIAMTPPRKDTYKKPDPLEVLENLVFGHKR